MKYAVLSLLFLCFLATGYTQASLTVKEQQANAEKQAKILSDHLLKKEYKAFAAFTHPTVVKMMGGIDKMAAYMEQAVAGMKSEGFTFTKISVSTPLKIIEEAKQLQCTITQHIELTHAEGKLLQKSTLIGISVDRGANWTYIDTHGESLQKLQETMPELSNQLIIPKMEEPQVIED
ncbi:MAG: hypothetical protein H7Y86_11760 [Rhizobacter sp.]|nr:hypothetical protein [Ferruginibacter sp.]